ncbi:MAG: hypothetical protein CMP21_04835 [Rickettsiales bacterium]|mgnify:CR=1 FL=1|nr:hypothetical protein [Rickettsiales bacterium]|tara:strand:- start:168 stop:362 length:195 start_codon:yes stop_codon:yes gene_type:complete
MDEQIDKDQTKVHIAKFASASGGGLFKAAMNDQEFMKRVAKVLISDNKKSNNTLSQSLSKLLGK